MAETADPAAWKRLGEQLTLRRAEIDPRYANRTLFAAERDIDYRLAYDIEEGRRSNYRTTTLAGIATAYAVTLDSMRAVLSADGRLEGTRQPPAPPAGTTVPPLSFPGASDADHEAAARVFPGDKAAQALLLGGDIQGLAEWLEYRRDRAAHGYPEHRRQAEAGLTGAFPGIP